MDAVWILLSARFDYRPKRCRMISYKPGLHFMPRDRADKAIELGIGEETEAPEGFEEVSADGN